MELQQRIHYLCRISFATVDMKPYTILLLLTLVEPLTCGRSDDSTFQCSANREAVCRLSGALWGLFVGDALAMPVHWYYDLAQFREDFGYIRDYQVFGARDEVSPPAIGELDRPICDACRVITC